MTIAQAFNEIAVAQGGTASTSGTIAGAIDALNDALAGADQPSASTIESAVRLLGQHIGGGGYGTGLPIFIEDYEQVSGLLVVCFATEQDSVDENKTIFQADGNNGSFVIVPGGSFAILAVLGVDYANGAEILIYNPDSGDGEPFSDFTLEYDDETSEWVFKLTVPEVPIADGNRGQMTISAL